MFASLVAGVLATLHNDNVLMVLFTMVNVLIHVDKAILPGASNEVNHFIVDTLSTTKPDIFLGILQSAFIIGLLGSTLLFSHMTHYIQPFKLMAVGLSVWLFAILCSGLAYYAGSFSLLLTARALTGVGDASFQVVVPPFISDNAGSAKGKWMALFYAAVPFGTAIGLSYSGFLASTSIGWSGAYLTLAVFGACLVALVIGIPVKTGARITSRSSTLDVHESDTLISAVRTEEGLSSKDRSYDNNGNGVISNGRVNGVRSTPSSKNSSRHASPNLVNGVYGSEEGNNCAGTSQPGLGSPFHEHNGDFPSSISSKQTWRQEIGAVLNSPIFVCLALGYSAYAAVMMGVSTFGPSFLVGLGLFPTEREASATFGIVVVASGILGNLTGGALADRTTRGAMSDRGEGVHANGVPVVGGGAADRQLRTLLAQLCYLTASSSAVLWCAALSAGAGYPSLFTLLLFTGCFLAFMPTTHFNVALMLSVDRANRAFALSVNLMTLHLLGDVPSPILVGTLKDWWAPHCTMEESGVRSAECVAEAAGLMYTILIVVTWLGWTVVFTSIGYNIQTRRCRKRETGALLELSDDEGSDSIREPLLKD